MMAGTEVAERPVSCLAVRVGCLPGQIQNILLDVVGELTVADALATAKLVPEGYEIRINGTPAGLDSLLTQGDTVLLVRKIRGN